MSDATSDWPSSNSPFEEPMARSIKQGIEISNAHLTICLARKDNGATQLIMYNNYKLVDDALMVMAGNRTEEMASQPVFTGFKVAKFDLMATKLERFKILVSTHYDSTTDEYKLIFGANLNRFYEGTYAQRANSVNALAIAMDLHLVLLAAAIEVRAYHDDLTGTTTTQHTEIDDVSTSSINIRKQLMVCAGVMDQNLGYAKVMNATILDVNTRRANIDSWFPLNLIRVHATTGFTETVNAMMTKYLGTKTFKPGEKVKVTVVGASLNIGTSYDRTHAATRFITFNDGAPVTIDPFTSTWDLTQHNWVATNLDGTNPSHVVFEFVKAV